MSSYDHSMDRVGFTDAVGAPSGRRTTTRGKKPSKESKGTVPSCDMSPMRHKWEAERRSSLGHDGRTEKLREMGFSTGLANALSVNKDAFQYRFWLVDNSGSMQIHDGHRVVQTSDRKVKAQSVTRWEEIQETVVYHAQIAAILRSPTLFTLLNDPGEAVGPQEFSVASKQGGNVEDEIRQARNLMLRASPTGVTPLTSHIVRIQQWLSQMAPRLRREGRRVAVILATDGLPTDEEGYGGEEITEEFIRALRSLEGLPVWVVIRLCTDEDDVTKFYNELDGRLELSLEVLDDFLGEAREVYGHNRWLNYSLPMHRSRELGYQDRLFDLVDERPLTKGELRDFCALLFGEDVHHIPDPNRDWKEFLKYIDGCLQKEDQQWDPIRKKLGPLINLRMLHKCYGKGKCTIM